MSEKIADIVAQMRGRGEDGRMDMSLWRQYADRIEEAAKREKAETEAEALAVGGVVEAARQKHVGNAAAMREALEPWIAFGEWLLGNAGKDRLGEAIRENGPIIRQRLEELRAALSAPARNCDVGTAEEQSERMEKAVCSKHHGCVRCPLGKAKYSDCSLGWAQMPYSAEEGVAK